MEYRVRINYIIGIATLFAGCALHPPPDAARSFIKLIHGPEKELERHVEQTSEINANGLHLLDSLCSPRVTNSSEVGDRTILTVRMSCLFGSSNLYIHTRFSGNELMILGAHPGTYHGRWHMGKGVEEIDRGGRSMRDSVFRELGAWEKQMANMLSQIGEEGPNVVSRTAFDRQLEQDRLVSDNDSGIVALFSAQRSGYDSLAVLYSRTLQQNDTAKLHDGDPDPGPLLIERIHWGDAPHHTLHFVIGGKGEEIGLLKGPVIPPSPDGYFFLQPLGNDWFVYKKEVARKAP